MRRRTSALLAASVTATVVLSLTACGGGSDDNVQPPPTTATGEATGDPTQEVPTQADTTSVPGYTLSPQAVGTTASAPVVATAPAQSDLSVQASGFAAAADKYIKSGNTAFANDDNMLDPVKFLGAIGWHAPAGFSVARIDTDNQGGVSYQVCIAKDSGAWVVYDSKQHKVVASGPKNQACGDM